MSEEECKDFSSNHHHRTEIPNILFLLGLKPNELAVYLVLKRTAGDQGSCTKSSKRIAEEAGINIKTYYDVKKSLTNIFNIINKPINCVTNSKSEAGDKDTSLIKIIDIWPENYRYFYQQKEPIPKTEQVHPKTDVPPKKEGGGVHPKTEQQVHPKTEHKEDHYEEDPYIEIIPPPSGGGKSSKTQEPEKSKAESPNLQDPKTEKLAAAVCEKILFTDSNHRLQHITRSDIHRQLIRFGFTNDIIEKTILKFHSHIQKKRLVGNVFKLIQSIAKRIYDDEQIIENVQKMNSQEEEKNKKEEEYKKKVEESKKIPKPNMAKIFAQCGLKI